MLKEGGVDTPEKLQKTIDFCKLHNVDQLTIRPLRRPVRTDSVKGSSWVANNGITEEALKVLQEWTESRGTKLRTLSHGATVYDLQGQNVCVADCLTVEAESDEIRTLIYFRSGLLKYDWQYGGAVLLGAVDRANPS